MAEKAAAVTIPVCCCMGEYEVLGLIPVTRDEPKNEWTGQPEEKAEPADQKEAASEQPVSKEEKKPPKRIDLSGKNKIQSINNWRIANRCLPVPEEEVRTAVQNGTVGELLNHVPVKKDDLFYIEAGTVHAIGAGCLIAEIQQSSNLTYRLYDYDRVGRDGKKRELHVEKALAVTKLEPPTRGNKPLADIDIFPHMEVKLLADCEYFKVYHANLHGESFLHAGDDSFQSLTVLEGALKLSCGKETLTLAKGNTVFVPAGTGSYQVTGQAEFILSNNGR
jgi:mannose-6-phosphate isomerase class I